MLTGSGAGHGEEDHGGKEWGKSAAAIRQRHKDGRPVPNRDRQEIRQAGRGGGISTTKGQLITINQRLIYLSKRPRRRLFLSLGNSINFRDAGTIFFFLRPRVCPCVRTALFIVQAGYGVFPGEETQRGSRKCGTSQWEGGGRQRADAGRADDAHAGSWRKPLACFSI